MKVQMMAEAEMNTASTIGEGIEMRQRTPYSSEHNPRLSETQAELGASDIEQDVYEGGLKSWEGASDLARYLLSRENSTTDDYEALKSHVIEVGQQTRCCCVRNNSVASWGVELHCPPWCFSSIASLESCRQPSSLPISMLQ